MDAFFQRKFDILHLCFFQYKIFERKEKTTIYTQRLKFSEAMSFNIKLNKHFEDTSAPNVDEQDIVENFGQKHCFLYM